jgi:hypothetical protein
MSDVFADLRHLVTEPEAPSGNGRTPEQPVALTLDPAALHGVAGRLVATISPTTEADPAAILMVALVLAGNVMGRVPHAVGGGARHGSNLFAVIVGKSRGGRKGTALAVARDPFARAYPDWFRERLARGLSSGEGLIAAVRDAVSKAGQDGGEVVLDEGVADKRLCVLEPEFGVVLKVLAREGNTLSAHLRAAWDGDDLAALTKNPQRATAPHISILAQITPFELEQLLSGVDASNGFANRFLWVHAHRARSIPRARPPEPAALNGVVVDLKKGVDFALKHRAAVDFAAAAGALWDELYDHLVGEDAEGLAAEVTSRGEAQVLRLALIYALLDRKPAIQIGHLMAAFAVWQYCEQSAYLIFGDRSGDSVADRILDALRQTPGGLSRTDISAVLGRNVRAARIAQALGVLERARRVSPRAVEETGGRHGTVYEINEVNEESRRGGGDTSFYSSNSYNYMAAIRAWLRERGRCLGCGVALAPPLVRCASCVAAGLTAPGGAS